MKKTILLAALTTILAAQNAHAGPAMCYGHVLPKSRNLCLQVFEAGRARGLEDGEIARSVHACGWLIPSSVQGCLQGLLNELRN